MPRRFADDFKPADDGVLHPLVDGTLGRRGGAQKICGRKNSVSSVAIRG